MGDTPTSILRDSTDSTPGSSLGLSSGWTGTAASNCRLGLGGRRLLQMLKYQHPPMKSFQYLFFPRKIDLFCSIPIDGTCLHYHPLPPSASFYECGPTPLDRLNWMYTPPLWRSMRKMPGAQLRVEWGKKSRRGFQQLPSTGQPVDSMGIC